MEMLGELPSWSLLDADAGIIRPLPRSLSERTKKTLSRFITGVTYAQRVISKWMPPIKLTKEFFIQGHQL
jgi:hypothetical protein